MQVEQGHDEISKLYEALDLTQKRFDEQAKETRRHKGNDSR